MWAEVSIWNWGWEGINKAGLERSGTDLNATHVTFWGGGGAVIVVNFEQEYIVRTNKFQPKAEIAWV